MLAGALVGFGFITKMLQAFVVLPVFAVVYLLAAPTGWWRRVWQVCLLGVIMALGVPAIAWIENSALLVTLIIASVIGLAVVLWWHLRGSRTPAA